LPDRKPFILLDLGGVPIDDAAANVEAARRSGMQAVRAEGFVDVTNLLRRRALFD